MSKLILVSDFKAESMMLLAAVSITTRREGEFLPPDLGSAAARPRGWFGTATAFLP